MPPPNNNPHPNPFAFLAQHNNQQYPNQTGPFSNPMGPFGGSGYNNRPNNRPYNGWG